LKSPFNIPALAQFYIEV